MAKQSRRPRPSAAPTRKQEAHSRRDREQQRQLWIGVSVVSVVIAVVIGLGLYQTLIGQSRTPVAKVNGVDISTGDYQKELKFRRWNLLQTFASFGSDPTQINDYLSTQLPQQVLENMITDQLIRQEARKRTISVSQDEVGQDLERQFGYYRVPPTPSPVPTVSPSATVTATTTPPPTATPLTEEAYKKQYNDYMTQLKNVAGFSEQDFRRDVESNLLRDKVEKVIVADVPTQTLQIHARYIITDTEEAAKAIKTKLDGGADFAAVAKADSKDEATRALGGDLGWVRKGEREAEFDQVAFVLGTGQTTPPVKTAQGWEIIQVLEREENRPLSPKQFDQAKSDAFNKWLSDVTAAASIQRSLTPDKIPPMATAQPAG